MNDLLGKHTEYLFELWCDTDDDKVLAAWAAAAWYYYGPPDRDDKSDWFE